MPNVRITPILTLLHNPGNLASRNTLSLLRSSLRMNPDAFSIDVLDYAGNPPTSDQAQLISSYLNKSAKSEVGNAAEDGGTGTAEEFLQLARNQPEADKKPILVDWQAGRAIFAGERQSVERFLEEGGYLKNTK
ncbi:5061_t:CDS:1 [Paraglomus brasilianum]|uniref:5061_t:CDS:1 n=1 Tax=Paraglomus brasilianum TaxID=144538 RepID=A0A9N8ZXB2_9GLOM|nr:5061_t:CDS:1 [Paraglomus brasilianum]